MNDAFNSLPSTAADCYSHSMFGIVVIFSFVEHITFSIFLARFGHFRINICFMGYLIFFYVVHSVCLLLPLKRHFRSSHRYVQIMSAPLVDRTTAATVAREVHLRVLRQLSEERIIFIRELSAVRSALENAQQLYAAAQSPTHRGGGGGAGTSEVELMGNSLQAQSTKRVASVAKMNRGGEASPPSAPSIIAPELMSMRMLNDALSSAQTVEELNELHALELKEKDDEIADLRQQIKDGYAEKEAQWNATLRAAKHQSKVMQEAYEQERERHRMDARMAVGEELFREREATAELRRTVDKLQKEVEGYRKHVSERDNEARSLRTQISALHQERVGSHVERTECRAALMAISSDKLALERRVRQLEGRGAMTGRQAVTTLATSPQTPSIERLGGGGGGVQTTARKSFARSFDSRDASTGGASMRMEQAPSAKAPKALDALLEFALDDEMAVSVRSSILNRAKPPA